MQTEQWVFCLICRECIRVNHISTWVRLKIYICALIHPFDIMIANYWRENMGALAWLFCPIRYKYKKFCLWQGWIFISQKDTLLFSYKHSIFSAQPGCSIFWAFLGWTVLTRVLSTVLSVFNDNLNNWKKKCFRLLKCSKTYPNWQYFSWFY